ncbi:MAG: hypothetical protein HY817_00955 [Candidatus Abawacabacteria bacterium]|nr:hypothetical protein [Candidatus Abawacabacteria bacterium]
MNSSLDGAIRIERDLERLDARRFVLATLNPHDREVMVVKQDTRLSLASALSSFPVAAERVAVTAMHSAAKIERILMMNDIMIVALPFHSTIEIRRNRDRSYEVNSLNPERELKFRVDAEGNVKGSVSTSLEADSGQGNALQESSATLRLNEILDAIGSARFAQSALQN